MKCASEPSAYRYWSLRVSVRTGLNFSPARKVLSITLPSVVRLSLVRTNAGPLPGLTCWNSTILKIVPSTSMCVPFLNWLVLIIGWKGREASSARLPGEIERREAGGKLEDGPAACAVRADREEPMRVIAPNVRMHIGQAVVAG